MARTSMKGRDFVKDDLKKEVDDLKKEVVRLNGLLAAIKNQKDAYFLEIREEEGGSCSITRSYYKVKRDAMDDLNIAKAKFVGNDTELAKTEPRQVARGSVDLTMSREDGTVFRGTITRIKII
jgi:hypothetical protein